MYEMTCFMNMVLVQRGIVLFARGGYVYGVLHREVWEKKDTESLDPLQVRDMERVYSGILFRIPECEL